MQAEDGHQFRAYHAPAHGAEIGRVVLAPEIFGINHHIRAVCDGFAADGYRVIAPDLFERAEPAVELPYNKTGIQRGRALKGQVSTEAALLDLAAALGHDWKVIFKKSLILINLMKSMGKDIFILSRGIYLRSVDSNDDYIGYSDELINFYGYRR